MDIYQPIYDVVRSRISSACSQDIIRNAVLECFGSASHMMQNVQMNWQEAAYEQQRPCVVFKPALFQDGDYWCALFGEYLTIGVSGFGDSLANAMADFDKNWCLPMAGSQSGATS